MAFPSENKDLQKSWYLVYTKPRQEVLAQANLLRQGYSVYLPRVRQFRRRRGQQEAVVEALFPRYLFIHLDTQYDNWAPVRSTFGVVSLVRFGSEPAQVPNQLVDHLRAQEGQDGLHAWAESKIALGDRVRVINGPLKGYAGILLGKTGQERVMLLLEMLGTEVRTHLSPAQIERSDE
jgi:transcriptional antiterminator RfaH